jgi:uncharacterized protein (DUF1330 family)
MPAYAIANVQSITMGPAIAEYLERIDATLAPYDGQFLCTETPPTFAKETSLVTSS